MKEQRTKQILICLAASLGCFWLGNRVGLLYVSAVGTVTQRLAAAVNLSKIVLYPLQLSPAPIPVGCGVGAILLAGLAEAIQRRTQNAQPPPYYPGRGL